jgi:transposase InsO family protein
VRQAAVTVADWAEDLAVAPAAVAAALGVAPRTLRHWQQQLRPAALRVVPLGRPTARSGLAERQAVLGFLHEVGPGVGLPVRRGQFPLLTRAELRDLLGRYRHVWRQRHPRVQHVLTWPVPGTVWAMDSTQPPAPIDGVYPWLLAVRDLASGYPLLWWPVRQGTGEATAARLAELFALFGAPLVLKSDNGSAEGSTEVQELLAAWEVVSLFSPPGCPWYNGAIEAAIGSWKTRTAWQAVHAGHAGAWTRRDVEAAWGQANATARPRGWRGPTPTEAWAARPALPAAQREVFTATVAQLREVERAARGLSATDEVTVMEGRALDRSVLSQALVALGYLTIGRRRVLPPLPTRRAARIT